MSTALALRTGLIGTPLANGLLLPPDLTFDEWRSALETAELIEAASPWWLTDVIAYGRRFGEDASQALPTAEEDPYGVRQARLKQAAWMAERWPPDTRVPELSFTHHRAVAGVDDPAERRALLAEAVEQKLSTRALAARVAERQAAIDVLPDGTCAADAPWRPSVDDLIPEAREALLLASESVLHPAPFIEGALWLAVWSDNQLLFRPDRWRD